jgi:hypothetical protein
MTAWRTTVLVGLACCLGPVSKASEPGVRPAGVFAFSLPGLSASPAAKAKALLWCQGSNLVGVLVPDARSQDCSSASQRRSAPSALLLRDGRCESGGSTVSFGLLAARKAWVFEASGRVPVERKVWLLHRFEGSLQGGQLKGVLVHVDVNHPGYPFEKKSIEAETLSDEQAPFGDETAWRSGMAQAFCLEAGEP